MMIRFYSRWLLVPLLFLSLQISRAQDTFDYFFDGEFAPVWDLSGTYNVTLPVLQKSGIETEVSFGFVLAQDAKGRLSAGSTSPTGVFIGNNGAFAGFYRIAGKVIDGSRVTLVIQLRGDGEIGGRETFMNMTVVLANAFIIPNESGGTDIIGSSKVSATFAGLTKLRGNAEFFTPLPGGMDGSWLLSLDVATLQDPVGTGTVTLANGRELVFNLNGKYSPRNGVSKVKLTGTGESQGSQINLLMSPFGDLFGLQGKLLGQKVVF